MVIVDPEIVNSASASLITFGAGPVDVPPDRKNPTSVTSVSEVSEVMTNESSEAGGFSATWTGVDAGDVVRLSRSAELDCA